ncbi:hypothetical protein BSZ14_03215 [Sphingomonas sp. Sph1(2015)]|jgi:hypothetical protein|nr:hypothetical protein BSZ14_03215 [Sphingomonas sp. Sph1(2015)]
MDQGGGRVATILEQHGHRTSRLWISSDARLVDAMRADSMRLDVAIPASLIALDDIVVVSGIDRGRGVAPEAGCVAV